MFTSTAWDSQISKTHIQVCFWIFTEKTKLQYVSQTLTHAEATLLYEQLKELLYKSEAVIVSETTATE